MALRLLDPCRDGPALYAIFGDQESCRYMSGPAVKSIDKTISLLKKWGEGAEESSWAIVEAYDGEALGRVSMIARGRNVWEAAVMMCPGARGRGLAISALAEALDIIFENHDARRVYADIDPDNAPCIRLFERLGFQKEGVLRATWVTHFGVRNTLLMALIDGDPRPWKTA